MQEVLQRLRERRQSRLHTSQDEIAGIMECSEQQAESDSGAEDGEPAAGEPRAGPQMPEQAGPSDPKLPDMEDMGDLAWELAAADSEAGQARHLACLPLYPCCHLHSCLHGRQFVHSSNVQYCMVTTCSHSLAMFRHCVKARLAFTLSRLSSSMSN